MKDKDINNDPTLIADALRVQGYRITKARENIIMVLCKGGHYTVEEIVAQLRNLQKEKNGINVATVYNNVNFLVSEGIINEYNFNNKNSVYELNIGLHAHLVCLDCAEVINIDIPEFAKIRDRVEKKMGFEIINAKLDMYGKCKSCSTDGKTSS